MYLQTTSGRSNIVHTNKYELTATTKGINLINSTRSDSWTLCADFTLKIAVILKAATVIKIIIYRKFQGHKLYFIILVTPLVTNVLPGLFLSYFNLREIVQYNYVLLHIINHSSKYIVLSINSHSDKYRNLLSYDNY